LDHNRGISSWTWFGTEALIFTVAALIQERLKKNMQDYVKKVKGAPKKKAAPGGGGEKDFLQKLMHLMQEAKLDVS